jgi:hypothetical protein
MAKKYSTKPKEKTGPDIIEGSKGLKATGNKTTKKKARKGQEQGMRPGCNWAWAILMDGEWCPCHWSEPTQAQLMQGKKPSLEARIFKVRMPKTTRV